MGKEYFYYDPDTGAKIPCSKEFLEGMKKIWDEAKPKLLQGYKVGNVIITGTKRNPYHCKHNKVYGTCDLCYLEYKQLKSK